VIVVVTSMKGTVGQVLARQLLGLRHPLEQISMRYPGRSQKNDFIHKIAVASKEASETEYWLEPIYESEISDSDDLERLLNEERELKAILISIGKNTKFKIKKEI